MSNLEIKDVPDKSEPFDTVQKVCAVVGESLTQDDMDICHKVGTNKCGMKHIVVHFVQCDKRIAVLAKVKRAMAAIGFGTSHPFMSTNS